MSTTTEEVTTDQAYEAAVARVRDYREQLQGADRQADRNSLDRARDLELIYQSMRWVDELPAPKHQVWRGRPVDPQSRNRFASWVLQQTGLQPSRVGQLHRAYELVGIISTTVRVIPDGERPLRPFERLRKAGYGDHIPEVYKRALELAEGQPPTSAETNRAVRDFLAKYSPAERRRTTAAVKAKTQADRLKAQFINILGADAELAGLTLNALIDLYNEQVKQ